jgi:ATP-binding cassette subfamily F protein 3
VLLEALQDFEGTLCLVSHDRDFVTPLVDTVLEILPSEKGSSVQALLGSYEDYLERKMRENADQKSKLSKLETPSGPKSGAAKASGVSGGSASGSGATAPAKAKPDGISNNQRRAWEKERDAAEAEVGRMEARLAELTAQLSTPGAFDDKAASLKLVHEQAETARDLETRLKRWEELCELLG